MKNSKTNQNTTTKPSAKNAEASSKASLPENSATDKKTAASGREQDGYNYQKEDAAGRKKVDQDL